MSAFVAWPGGTTGGAAARPVGRPVSSAAVERDEALNVLARRSADGDETAFARLCEDLSDDVWRYCLALSGERDLARDAAQDTFLRLVTAIRRYRGAAPVRVYTLVIARRAVAACLRRERRHRGRTGEPVDREAPDALGAVEVSQVLGALPADMRQALVLTQLLGLPYEQAARVEGVAVGTIRSRVSRARERMLAGLREDADGHP